MYYVLTLDWLPDVSGLRRAQRAHGCRSARNGTGLGEGEGSQESNTPVNSENLRCRAALPEPVRFLDLRPGRPGACCLVPYISWPGCDHTVHTPSYSVPYLTLDYKKQTSALPAPRMCSRTLAT